MFKTRSQAPYPPIADYGVIGNTQSAALVSSSGSIDWACLPRFNSPAFLLKLLDQRKGGFCDFQVNRLIQTRRAYVDQTAILKTLFETETGAMELEDFMPVDLLESSHMFGQDTVSESRIIRRMRCVQGEVSGVARFKPTFSYASEPSRAERQESGWIFHGREHSIELRGLDFRQKRGLAEAGFLLKTGEETFITVTHGPSPGTEKSVADAYESTLRYWKAWASRCSYEGPYREIVLRSAITLKLLTYERTGAILAAPTTSLPEQIGGERNWDYRFSWIRDSSFTVSALMLIGYREEARDFFHFLQRMHRPDDEHNAFRVLYSIDGNSSTAERTLDHLEGYRNSRPVRIGNAASTQLQLDIYGELMSCIYEYTSKKLQQDPELAPASRFWSETIHAVAKAVISRWREPDQGFWEIRGKPRHMVHSKALCWLALDRAIKLHAISPVSRADHDLQLWEAERDLIAQEVLEKGYNPEVQSFTESYGCRDLDAAILRLPLIGAIDSGDARMKRTIERVEKELMRNGLVYRYRNVDDGVSGTEGTFAICSLWLVANYHLQGKQEQATDLFHHVLSYANDLGLFAEQIDPETGDQLGNFPQAFTHIAIISVAKQLPTSLEEEHQKVRKTAPIGSRPTYRS